MDAVDELGALSSSFPHSQLFTLHLLTLLIIFERAIPEDGAAASLEALRRACKGYQRCPVPASKAQRKGGTQQAVKALRMGCSEYC